MISPASWRRHQKYLIGVNIAPKKRFYGFDSKRDCQEVRANITSAEMALSKVLENWRIADLQCRQQVVTSSDVLDARSSLTRADTDFCRLAGKPCSN